MKTLFGCSKKRLVTSVAQQVDGENPNVHLTSDDVLMCVLPMFHIYALNSILLCGLRVGAAIVLVQRFEIGSFLGAMERYKVTYGPFVPPIVLAVAKSEKTEDYDLSAVRMVQSGAAPLGKEMEEAVRAKFRNATLGQVNVLSVFRMPSLVNAVNPVITRSFVFAY